MTESTVLITSPHNLCPITKNRACDYAAGFAAQLLTEVMGLYTDYLNRVLYFPGNEFRSSYDLNRKNSRNTKFRKNIRTILQQLKQNNIMRRIIPRTILFDIHSFPNYYMDEAGDINFFKKGEVPHDIVLICSPIDIVNNKSLSYSLYNNFVLNNFKCKIMPIIPVNDILNEATEYGIPAILIEINEKYILDKQSTILICQIIAQVSVSLVV